MTVAVLNVKIDETVKEGLRHYAEANGLTLSAATEKLLQRHLQQKSRRVYVKTTLTASIRKKMLHHSHLKKSKHYEKS